MPQISNPTATADLTDEVNTIDTVVDAIKAVTDNIPNSGAMSDITTAVNSRLGAIAGIDRLLITQGEYTTSKATTISSVTITRSIVTFLGNTNYSGSAGAAAESIEVHLTDATTVTSTKYATGSNNVVSVEVVEFGA